MRVQRRQGFNPQLGLLDYSGYERAAEIDRQSMASLGQNIGEAVRGYREEKENDKFRRGFAEELISDMNRKNADGTTDPSAARRLAFFNVNAGDFVDQNDEQKVDTLVEALSGYDKDRLQTLRDGFALKELETKQKIDIVRAEGDSLLNAHNLKYGKDGNTVEEETIPTGESIEDKLTLIENNRNLPLLDDEIKNKVTEIKSKDNITKEDVAILDTVEKELKKIPRRSETGAMGVMADLPSNMLGLIGDIPAEIMNLRRDRKFRTQFTPEGEIPVVGGSDFFRQFPRYTTQPAKSLYNYLGFK